MEFGLGMAALALLLAGYIYGAENRSSPGDGFAAEQADAEVLFARYRWFPYKEPWWQKAADFTSLAGLAIILAGLGGGLFGLSRERVFPRHRGTGQLASAFDPARPR